MSIFLIVGIVLGSHVNAFIYPKPDGLSFAEWYRSLFAGKLFCILNGLLYAFILFMLFKLYNYSTQFFLYGVLFFLLLLISIFDIRTKTIPNRYLAVCLVFGLFTALLNSGACITVIASALAIGAVLALISCISKGGIGMGDAKLLACISLYLGLGSTLAALTAATIASGIYGLMLIMVRKADRKKQIAFAPFALIGTFIITVFR